MAKIEVKVDTRRLRLKLNKVNKKANLAWRLALPQLIFQFIKKGISPVNGKGRFVKYAQSYRDAIQMKTAFWNKGGKVHAISAVSTKDLRSLRASKTAKSDNKKNKDFIKEHNKHLKGKRVAPRNLTLTGKMLRSIKAIIKKGALRIDFTDKKASYHNEGTENIPRRAMLPTKTGEEFNKNITLRLRQIAKIQTIKTFK